MSLPNNYIKLKWIGSTGTQYINTGITPTLNYNIEVVGIKDPYSSLFGSGECSYVLTGNSSYNNYFYIGQTLASPTESGQIINNITQTTSHTWKIKDGIGYCDGVTASPIKIGTTQPTYPLFLFGRSKGGVFNDGGTHKIYSVKLYNSSGVLVLDMIPALRRSDFEPGLYDLVGNVFYTNQGTSEFEYELENYKSIIPTSTNTQSSNYKTYIYLPPVPTGYTVLEYIQSTGTQYIDCGIKYNITDQIEISYELTNPSGDQSMFAVGVQGVRNKYAGHRTWDSGVNQVFFINYDGRISIPVTANTKYNVIFNRQTDHKVIVNDVVIGTLGTNYVNPGNNMFIFAEDTVINGVQQPWGYAKAKLYYFNLYDSTGDAVYNLIPAKRNSDNVIGMWDAAKNIFLTNAGSGVFTAGPEIITNYTYNSYKTLIKEN